MKYLQVSISAENRQQADKILNSLLEKKLVTGGMIITAPARFIWKGKLTDMDYCTIQSYTLGANKDAIIADVKKTTVEDVPMIAFTQFDGNLQLLKWIGRTLSGKR